MSTQNEAGTIESRDVDEFSELVSPWELRLSQLSPGPFYSRIEFVQINGIFVYRERLARRELGTGAAPTNYFTFGGALSARNPVEWCGGEVAPEQLSYARPGSEVDFVLPDDSDHVAMFIPESLMRSYFGPEAIDLALSDHRHHLAPATRSGSNLLRELASLVGRYHSRPDRLADARECNVIESQIMQMVTEVFPYDSTEVHFATRTRRREAFLRAIRIGGNLGQRMAVPDLAAATGVSPRTLSLAFKESLGLTPQKYLLWRRLQHVHNELHTKTTESTSVAEVANRWGFSELGRFAVDYKRLFGESPSVTLRARTMPKSRRFRDILPR
jgi:AraC family ethanolamine operon transcriptional activator